jgi:tetratricopeptide (TPR) repeat protein
VSAPAATTLQVGTQRPAPQGITAQKGLTGAPHIVKVYDAIFDGRFDAVPALIKDACPPAPQEACQLLETVALWWQIQIDPLNRRLDQEYQTRMNATVAATEAWTTREPQRAEAWFYRGGAYGARVQLRVLRGQQLAAARDGKRIKDALERALELDPDMHDAWFGIGLYHYYADIAPAAAKMLRWMLFLPGGNKAEGLKEMLKARNGGALLRSEADYQLHILYLWYEKQPARAIELLRGLEQRHPGNAHFPQLVAEIQDVYLHDLTASLRSWQALLDAAKAGKVRPAVLALNAARLGAALQLDRLFETDLAIEHLQAVVDTKPDAPFGALAQAHLQLGRAYDRMGQRPEAEAAYRSALAENPPSDPLEIAAQAKAGLRVVPRPEVGEAYRLSLAGWRALTRGRTADAGRALTRSLSLRPGDPVTQYRQAHLQLALRNEAAARAALDALTRARATVPPTIYASACVEAARLHEQRGTLARAIELYRTAIGVFGADQLTKDEARRSLARLTTAK